MAPFGNNQIPTASNLKYVICRPKPLMRKVRTSRRHLLAEKRAIHGTWYTFRNKTFLFVKIEI